MLGALDLAAFTSPHYLDAVARNAPQNVLRFVNDTAHMLVYDSGVLGLFLLGAWAARSNVALRPLDHGPLLRRIMRWCAPIGLVLSAVYALRFAGMTLQGMLGALASAAYVGLPVLAFAYLAALALAFARGAEWAQRLLAPIGRMALTGYLASGAIGAWAAYGYGLGLLGRFGIVELNLFAIALFAGLALFSHAWLAVFRQGPAEWLWRCLSHGAHQPLLRVTPPLSPARRA